MKPWVVLALGGAALAGCTMTDDVGPVQPSSQRSVTLESATPSSSTATPLEPTVDVSAIPSVPGWSPRPQGIGEGPGPDTPWASERDVDEVLQIWASYACLDQGTLPRPARVLEGAFIDRGGRPAVIERLDFEGGRSDEFVTTYSEGSVSCGTADRIGVGGLRREVQGSVWTEVLLADPRGVTIVIVEADLGALDVEELKAEVA